MLEGVDLADGTASVSVIEDLGGDGANAWYRVVISEGRNREVRRLMEHVGLTVSRLVRVRFGPVGLPRKLARNRWQELSADEIALLMQAVREAAAVAAAVDPDNPKLADDISDNDDGDGDDDSDADSGDEGHEGFFADPFDDDDEEYPDDAQPVHLFPADDVDPRFAKLSAEQLEDDDWQPSGDNAHQEGITKTVRETMAAMKTPGVSRRAARRGQGAGGTVWAGGPMDPGGAEASGMLPGRKGNKSSKGGARRKPGAGAGNGTRKRARPDGAARPVRVRARNPVIGVPRSRLVTGPEGRAGVVGVAVAPKARAEQSKSACCRTRARHLRAAGGAVRPLRWVSGPKDVSQT